MRLPHLFTLLALLAALLPGCVTSPDAGSLDVKLTSLRFVQSRVLETDAVFTLRIENESPEPIMLTGGVHKFYLDGTLLGKGLSNETMEIPRLSSVTQEITVHLSNITMARKIRPIIASHQVQTRAESLLYCSFGLKNRNVKVSHESTLDVNEFVPEGTLQKPGQF